MEKAQRAAAEGDVEEYKPVQTEFEHSPPIRPKVLFVTSASEASMKERLSVTTNTRVSLGAARDDREEAYDTAEVPANTKTQESFEVASRYSKHDMSYENHEALMMDLMEGQVQMVVESEIRSGFKCISELITAR
ncbi:hypothetical protein V5O48_018037 [Marasmius crinis-equi]|uniref:Uncharacterized protein n=1 Tax=Marasmius crinis-equi TaxID=585013 RepID=A0ABR3EMB8_9AGAR